MGETVRPVRIRGRGPAMLQLRVVSALSAVLLGMATWSGTRPDTGAPGAAQLASLAAVVAAAVLWQLWLLRPGIEVRVDEVRIRDVWTTTTIPVEYVAGFETSMIRLPLDLTARTVALVVHRCDGPATVVRWVAWMDLITPLLTAGSRPPTRSQQRVISRLEDALEAARATRRGSSGASSGRH